MIKSLFDEEEIVQKKIDERNKLNVFEQNIENDDKKNFSQNQNIPENIKEAESPANFLNKTPESEVERLISDDAEIAAPKVDFVFSNPYEPISSGKATQVGKDESLLFQMQNKPESTAETARKSGLAMSAAIALFGSVVFLLIIGWFADLLLGTSPWGIVAGIVLGSIIGFIQFFRTTSQILNDDD